MKPNIAQIEALKSLETTRKEGKEKSLVVLPSGSGKTILSAFDTKITKAKKILYIAHRTEIIEQASEAFRTVHGDKKSIGYITQDSKEYDKDILFATIQTISKPKNLKELKKINFDYVIFDEYHHAGAKTYVKVFKSLKYKFLLGMTATPFRLDRKDIHKQIDNNTVYSMDMKEGLNKGILVPFNYKGLWDDVDYSNIKYATYKYSETDLDKKLVISKRDNQIIKEFKKNCGKKQTIAFCVNVKHAIRLSKTLNENGIRSTSLTHKTKSGRRREILQRFRDKNYQVICTRDIFNEGVDFPEVEALLFLRPTFSKVVFLQQLGRGLRKSEGKKEVIVMDFIGNYVNAFQRKDWMEDIIGVGEGKPVKPLYNYKLSKVTFSSKVIKLFEHQESRVITKEKLIANYYDVKKQLRKQPRIKQMDTYGDYSGGTYENYFGNWTDFLISIKEPLILDFEKPTRKKLVEEYYRVKKALGKQPSYIDMRLSQSKYSHKKYRNEYGSWNNFLMSIKEPIRMSNKKMTITKEDLIKNYKDLEKVQGKKLDSNAINIKRGSRFGMKTYVNAFGSWQRFRKYMGEAKRSDRFNSAVSKNCLICKRKMDVIPCKLKTKRYCSNKCRSKGLSKVYLTNCKNCKKEFKNLPSRKSVYCSQKCYNELGRFRTKCGFCNKDIVRSKFKVKGGTKIFYCNMKCRSKKK